jgi:glycosyltransferase A (GT-A) superfamily protein (DUF2064 family)
MTTTMNRVGLAILARKAELGKGKTRLAKGIGVPQAFEAYKHLIAVTASVTKASQLPCTVIFDPEVGDTDVWPSEYFDYSLQVQSTNLGDRIAAGLEGVLAKVSPSGVDSRASTHALSGNAHGTDRQGALIMGTDCPTLTPAILQEAAKALETKDAVLGPSFDGGFYLLGVRKVEPTLFDGVEWSTERVADQMIAAFERLGYDYQLSPKLADIDEKEDWEHYLTWRSQQQLNSEVLKDKTLS